MADLRGVDIKLARARRHLNDLHEAIGRALEPDRYQFIRAVDGAPSKLVYRVRGVPRVDPEWSAIVGDYLINLRAALDHLAWQLVLLDGGQPTRATSFPIGDPANARILPHISADASAILNSVMPFEPAHREHHPLWLLSDFCRIDRHRLLLVLVCMLDVENIWWGLPEGVTSPKVRLRVGGTIADDDEVAWFDFGETVPGPDFDPHLALTVRLNEGPFVTRTNPLVAFLEGLRWSVEDHTVAAFRPLFTSVR
jgi:hypothetical protein